MRNKLIALLLAAAALALCACGGGKGAEEPGQENTSLYVVTSYGPDDGNRKNFEAAVRAYEEATGNHVVDGSGVSNEEWKTKVMTDFMTGSEPDVLFYFTNADADPFINAGRVVSIEEIRQVYPDYATNMKEAMMSVAADGKHYAVPSNGYWETLFVNKSVLEACGIPIPGPDYRWEQFLADCERIREAGFTPIACSLAEIPHYWFEFMVMNNGSLADHLEIPQLDEEGRLLDDAASRKWIAALEDIKALYEAGYFPKNTLTAADAETVALFARGEAAFLVDGSWKVGYFTDNYPDKLENFVVSYVPGKGERKASEAIGGISMGYFITRKAWEDPAKREAAVSFVFHMTSEDVLSSFVTTEATALLDGARPAGLNIIQQSAADANVHITGMVDAVQDTISGEASGELFADIPRVVTGQMTAREAVEAAIRLNRLG
jgi:raffinose/stachyose/melibiose transport system substrate-binding protein